MKVSGDVSPMLTPGRVLGDVLELKLLNSGRISGKIGNQTRIFQEGGKLLTPERRGSPESSALI